MLLFSLALSLRGCEGGGGSAANRRRQLPQRRAAEIADQLATGAMLDGYLYGRIVNATKEYDADKDWRIRL